jgi:4-hydroxy-3-methylbut-2-enyl diphosphate reductase
VVGSKNSSNSNRLRELAEQTGKSAYLIDKPDDIDPGWLTGSASVGVTAGASAPEQLVQQVIERLRELGADSVTEIPGRTENVMFALPKGLR